MSTFLEVQHCQMTFKGLQAVKEFSATIEAGTICGLIGTNGAGKTTVINMLSGVLTPTSGKILLEGEDITGLRPDQIARRGIVRTYQNLRLFQKMTVLENVIIGAQMNTSSHIGRQHSRHARLSPRRDSAAGKGNAHAGFDGNCRARRRHGRLSSIWPAAPAGDRPDFGRQPQAAFARRAGRGMNPRRAWSLWT